MLERTWHGIAVVVTFTLCVIFAAISGGAFGSMVGIVARELSPPRCTPGSVEGLMTNCNINKEVQYAK